MKRSILMHCHKLVKTSANTEHHDKILPISALEIKLLPILILSYALEPNKIFMRQMWMILTFTHHTKPWKIKKILLVSCMSHFLLCDQDCKVKFSWISYRNGLSSESRQERSVVLCICVLMP